MEDGGPACGKLYNTWNEVSAEDKASGRLRRTMFPPLAYSASPQAAAALEQQLPHCGRLLPTCDPEGGCFFLAVLRRVAERGPPLQRGDQAVVRSSDGSNVIVSVRGPGTGHFVGLVRVAYPDGTQYHVAHEDLECVAAKAPPPQRQQQQPTTAAGSEAAAKGKPSPPLLRAVSGELWCTLAAFYGLRDDPTEAAAAGVQPFPRAALVHGTAQGAPERGGCDSLCLASEAVRELASFMPWAFGRALFFCSKTIR